MNDWNNAFGFYANHDTAKHVLRRGRLAGLRRIALLHKTNGKIHTQSYQVSTLLWIWTLLYGLFLASFFFFGNFTFGPTHLLLIIGAIVTALWWIVDPFLYRIDPKILEKLQTLILNHESLVLVQVDDSQVPEALELLRHVETGHPTSFLIRSDKLISYEDRSELIKEPLNLEQMHDRATSLAEELKNAKVKKSHKQPLLVRLKASAGILTQIRHNVAEAEHLEQTITSSAEWLLDNTYVIQGNIEEVQRNLPKKFYQELPKITKGRDAGLPRIYVIAKELIQSCANKLSRDNITAFLNSYQTVDPLTIGELWALPLMMRLRLIECIQLLALDIDRRLYEGEVASFWGNRLLYAAKREPERIGEFLANLSLSEPNPSAHFAEELFDHLYDEETILPLVKVWLEDRFHENISNLVHLEQVQKSTEQVAFSSAIISLITLSQLSWREVFESVSIVDKILSDEPNFTYANMDFATRDFYRKNIERLSKGSKKSEKQVAVEVVKLADRGQDDVTRHVGYYLIDKGKPILESAVEYKPTFWQGIQRWMIQHPSAVYLGSIAVIISSILLFLDQSHHSIILLLLAIIPASELALQVINLVLSRMLPPFVLPKMQFERGIPRQFPTLVIIPTLLSNKDSIKENLSRLEVHYLANPDQMLQFGLLVDFVDAPIPHLEADATLLEIALQGMKDLENKYGADRFVLFYRERVFSKSENAWIGWERKRGKLESLNRFLVEGPHSDIILKFGNAEELKGIRFVITLDGDTQLPKDSARQLVSTLAHPLNTPRFSDQGLIERGYTIIQPKVSTNFVHSRMTLFSYVFSDEMSVDPYTQAVSNVYQDLMHEGTYHGKGIYDVNAFHHILSKRFPDEHLLSHDLIEGIYGRVGFASDIMLLDLFPKDYLTWIRRQHRWMRGDWQIIDWLFPSVPEHENKKVQNGLSVINRWKIFDNLRRAFIPIASFALLLVSWFFSYNPGFWTGFIAIVFFLPVISLVICSLLQDPRVFIRSPRQFVNGFLRSAINLAFLPHQAYVSFDACMKVLYRRFISKKKMLEWLVAQSAAGSHKKRFLLKLNAISFLSLLLMFAIYAFAPWSFYVALPIVALWFLSPYIVFILDQSTARSQRERLNHTELDFIRRVARRTWRYFDHFVGPQTNWLPPDNYQASLVVEVAERTSPTNIGLWLLAVLGAHDFRYITGDKAVQLICSTFETFKKLETYEGHFLNWYETRNLRPLYPRYVSTVDSGNFLASLWTLEQGLEELLTTPILPQNLLSGIRDTFEVMFEMINEKTVKESLSHVRHLLASNPHTLSGMINIIRDVLKAVNQFFEKEDVENAIYGYWGKKLKDELEEWENVISRYFSWTEIHPGEKCTISLLDLATGNLGNDLPLSDVQFKNHFDNARWFAGEKVGEVRQVIEAIHAITNNMNMLFLYNKDRKLFSIGYHVDDRKLDGSYYDLLASEARIASLVSIAKDDVPLDHWWALSRSYRYVDGRQVLMSWGGTMFEYLMPLLFNFFYKDSLLGQACNSAVGCQISYGQKRGIPWGISESAYSEIDVRKIYQYRSFGVPGIGFKTDLEEDLVVSPYSSALALAVMPKNAVKNLQVLSKAPFNMLSTYGFYESIDFARQHGPHGERGVTIYAYFAHHQGMAFLSFNNILNHSCMPRRFHAHPRISGIEPLLSEKTPIYPPIAKGFRTERPISRLTPFSTIPIMGIVDTPHSATPKVNLLSNGEYSIMLTNSGGGYSRWKNFDITRWYADTTRDYWGTYCYIQDVETKEKWSTSYHPLKSQGRNYSVSFKPDKVEIRRRDHDIETSTEIAISPEDNAEVRLMTIANFSKEERFLQLTSFSELVLAPHATDRTHPMFNKMFIETDRVEDHEAIMAFRRMRSPHDTPIFAAQVVATSEKSLEPFEFETDRNQFIGRGRNLENPIALEGNLTNTKGFVLDPIFSIRQLVRLKPGERIQVSFVTCISSDREQTIGMVKKYADISASHRAFDMSWTNSQLELRHLRIQQEEAQLFQKLASRILYPHAQLRPSTEQLKRNMLGQSHLWSYGISGDLPIVVVSVGDAHDVDLVKQILTAHAFWSMRGLKVDLVILNEEVGGYDQPLYNQILKIIQAHAHHTLISKPGGAYLLNCEQMPQEDVNLILAVSRANLVAARGFLRQQIVSPVEVVRYPNRLLPDRSVHDESSGPLHFMELEHFNGLGGFTKDGKEYAIYLENGAVTPAPWINVIANKKFGTIVTDSGSGTTWFGNSQTNRLTPWSNDPLLNPIHDTIYIRDEELGIFWTATPSPIREKEAYRTIHGQGYSRFEHNSHGIDQELTIFVPVDESMRIQRVKLKNTSSRKRFLSLTSYLEWVLGTDREVTQEHIITEWDSESQALFAFNRFNPDFGSHLAFVSSYPLPTSFSGNRTEFLGRNHRHDNPVCMRRKGLTGSVGAAIDPCAALQVHVELEPGEEKEVIFVLGYGQDQEAVRKMVYEMRSFEAAEHKFNEVKKFWDHLLTQISIETPDSSVNILHNRWLLYQVLSCRYWGRSAFYQSSGAFGFRDQLQDVMALLYAAPEIAREHILDSATHQFVEGDVQHWWHPPSNAGVRTRISDDLLWLPFVTAQYVRVTQDLTILDEVVHFIKGPLLAADQEESYFLPEKSEESATLLEHCRRAIQKGNTSGVHGLPLMGTGDWNDGMNLIGVHGKGESVWLAWFLIHVMNDFAELLTMKGEKEAAVGFHAQSKRLAENIEKGAWDGNWYLRAYFDDGSPLGSHLNTEDTIDSLTQSWAVISGAGNPDRIKTALKAVEEHIIKKEDKMVLLLTPPFNKTEHDPGYIKGYPPGVRENGGQYTHGSLWVPMAFARVGEWEKAAKLLEMMNPIHHAPNVEEAFSYKTEPYAVVADIYSLPGQVGRGGWSWYTGGAGWMYRIWLEEIFGFQLRGDKLTIKPRLYWDKAKLVYRYKSTTYEFNFQKMNHSPSLHQSQEISNPAALLPGIELQLVDDGTLHTLFCQIDTLDYQ